MKIADQDRASHPQAVPLLPWEIVALGTPVSGEPPMIEGQAAFYRAIVALSDALRNVGALFAKWKRAAFRPRVPDRIAPAQTDRQMYFISR
jgi:hypothetical protein